MLNQSEQTVAPDTVYNIETPMQENSFSKSDEEKIGNIEKLFSEIMNELGLDLNDESLAGTPHRVAKMYVKELFYGLNPANRPKISTFPNKYHYRKMLIEQDINLNSSCEHHFLPIVGKAHIGYIPQHKVIGLSKINRLVEYYAHRPQVQERLSLQILNDLKETLETDDVIIVIQAKHLCVSSRGIKDKSSFTSSLDYSGVFEDYEKRNEFFRLIDQ